MTLVCGGGTSQPKAGLQNAVTLDATGIESGLILFGFPEVAAALALVMGTFTFYLPNLCSTDPPADPNLTQQDILDALNFLDVAVSVPAIDRIRQWFEHRYWYQVCECATGTTTVPAPSNPGGLGTNTGIPSTPNEACFTNEYTQISPPPVSGSVSTDLTGKLLPILTPSVSRTGAIGGNVVTLPAWPLDASISRIHFDATVLGVDPGYTPIGNALHVNWITWDSAGTQLDDLTLVEVGSGGPEWSTTAPKGTTGLWTSTATHFAVWANINHIAGTTITESAWIKATGTCAGGPLAAACCPPDPSITSKLDQLYGLVLSVYKAIPVPLTSLSEGAVHATLSGSGSFSLASASLAVKIDLTTIPGYLGRELGDPLYYFEAGFVTAAGAEGPYASERVTFAQQVMWLPTLSATLHYSLAPGVVASVTELSRGP